MKTHQYTIFLPVKFSSSEDFHKRLNRPVVNGDLSTYVRMLIEADIKEAKRRKII